MQKKLRHIINKALITIDENASSYFNSTEWEEVDNIEYNQLALQKAKQDKIDELCLGYDKSYRVILSWTFNGVADKALLQNRAYPVDNRTYAITRLQNFRDQIAGRSLLVADPAVINAYQLVYGRPPIVDDFYKIPLHKYTNNRVEYLVLKQGSESAMISMCNNFLNDINTVYTNGFQPYVYYMQNQVLHKENIYALNTVEDIQNYAYNFYEIVCNIDSAFIEDVIYNV